MKPRTLADLVRAVAAAPEQAAGAGASIREDSLRGVRRFLSVQRPGTELWFVDAQELMFMPEAQFAPPSAPEKLAILINREQDLEEDRRRSVGHLLWAALADRRPSPGASGDARVRDMAFLGMSRLLARAGDEALDSDGFLGRPRRVRDEAIANAKKQLSWILCAGGARLAALVGAVPSDDVVIGGEATSEAAYDELLTGSGDPEALGERVVNDAWVAPRSLLMLSRSGGDRALASAARAVADELGLLMLTPLLELGPPPGPAGIATYFDDLVRAELDLRARVTKALVGHLEDTRDVPYFEELKGAPPDQKPVPRRVCDAAYLALRRMGKLGDDDQRSEDFLELQPSFRDRLVAEGKQTGDWRDPTPDEINASDEDLERRARR